MVGVIRTHRAKSTYFLDGQEVTEAEFWAAMPEPVQDDGDGTGLTGWKPIHSDALGYHPSQRIEAMEHLKKIGVPTYVDRIGRPVLESRSHRRKLLKALRHHDNNGGYGDG